MRKKKQREEEEKEMKDKGPSTPVIEQSAMPSNHNNNDSAMQDSGKDTDGEKENRGQGTGTKINGLNSPLKTGGLSTLGIVADVLGMDVDDDEDENEVADSSFSSNDRPWSPPPPRSLSLPVVEHHTPSPAPPSIIKPQEAPVSPMKVDPPAPVVTPAPASSSSYSHPPNGHTSRGMDEDDEVDYLGSVTSSPPQPHRAPSPRTPTRASFDGPSKQASPSRLSTHEEGEIAPSTTVPSTRASTPSGHTSLPPNLSFGSRPPPSAPRSFKLAGLSPSHHPPLPFVPSRGGGGLPPRPHHIPPGSRPLPSGPRALRAAAAAPVVRGFGFGGVPRGPSADRGERDRDRDRDRERDGRGRGGSGGWGR